jgi:BTB/POZ domain-containing protein 13
LSANVSFLFDNLVLRFPLFLLVLRYKPITKSQVSGYVDQNQESKKNCLKRTLTYLDLFIDQSILKPYQRDLKWGKHKSSPCVGFKFWRFSFGIHDYRWYAGWYFLLRFALFAGNLFAMDFLIMLLFNEVMCTFALIVSLVAQPYKRNIHNRVDSFILILMSVLNMSVFFQYYLTYTGQPLNPSTYVLQYLFVFLPAIMMVVYFIGRLFLNCRNHRGQVQSDNLEFSVTSLDTVPGDVEPSNHTDNRIGTAASYGTMQIPPNTLDKDDVKNKKISKLKSYIKQHLCNCERARE